MNRTIFVFSVVILLWLVLPAPLAAFTDNGDGTVTDPATGLMWDRCAWGQTGTNCSGAASSHNWQAALSIAVTANAANAGAGHRGYNDWRLPNRTELESLVDITQSNPAIDSDTFPSTPSFFFWSSTVFTPDPASAWIVSFGGGHSFTDPHHSQGLHVRLVRSGQSFDTLAAGVASQIAINAGDGQSAVAGEAVAVAPSVIARDANDNPVADVAVTFAVATGDGMVDPTTAVMTDANGIATVTSWTLGTAAGENTLTATADGLTGSPLTFTATGTVGEASQMSIFDGQDQSAVAGEDVTVPPSVRVADANNNPVEGVAVSFAVASGGGMVDPTTAVMTDASGIATVNSWTLGTAAGENTLTATAAGVAEPVIFTAMAIPVVPAIPVPTLGTWALLSLMMLMLAMAMAALLRPGLMA